MNICFKNNRKMPTLRPNQDTTHSFNIFRRTYNYLQKQPFINFFETNNVSILQKMNSPIYFKLYNIWCIPSTHAQHGDKLVSQSSCEHPKKNQVERKGNITIYHTKALHEEIRVKHSRILKTNPQHKRDSNKIKKKKKNSNLKKQISTAIVGAP